jgi:hypothetical protein
MRSVTFGNSFKFVPQKQNTSPDQRRVRFSTEDQQKYEIDDEKTGKISKEFFPSSDKAAVATQVGNLLKQRGINSQLFIGTTGTYLLTSGPDQDTLQLYNNVREDNPELRHTDKTREFENKLIEAGVINPDSNPVLNAKYRVNANSTDTIQLTNDDEILQTVGQ